MSTSSLTIKEPGLNVLPPGVERYTVAGGGITGIQILPEDEIEITNEDYGLRMVKTIRQENYNNDIWDQWVLFSRKIYDNMNKVLIGK